MLAVGKKFLVIFIACLCSPCAFAQPASLAVIDQYNTTSFPLVYEKQQAAICIDPADARVVSIAVHAFKRDVAEITGRELEIGSSVDDRHPYLVVAGTIGQSKWVDALIRSGKVSDKEVRGKWETFKIELVQHPFKNVEQALVVMGSDRRGTAFGIFELSSMIGVSPLTWWADVHPKKRQSILFRRGSSIQGPPSVKYRGIFINDEDWGLQPWAAKKMDTAIRDIGPNTYAHVFELLLRMKANYLWPAMHPCTKAFYYYKDDPAIADDYAIVIGTSHCEPMLRNNVFEWAENFENEYGKKPGEWRYDLNGQQIYQYWDDRVKATKKFESVYTVGMRGIHDGSMPGPKPMPEKVKLLQKIIGDQRLLLKTELRKTDAPQIFCPYKEVLDVYRNGVELPDDVTIVWSDDNHGYIRQLPDDKERQRSGRSGIYYHLSYWGSPHDYLWLSSLSPSLISYEMTKSYQYGADRLWIFNVGDIKPAEMEMQFAMDLAWNVRRWEPQNAAAYAHDWAEKTFGSADAQAIASIKHAYYQLAAEAKPEHMGSVSFSLPQLLQRIERYQSIAKTAEALEQNIPVSLKDAYFQLVYYPVKGATLMNEKIGYARLSLQKAATDRDSALYYAAKASAAFGQIQTLTERYNKEIAGGKWDGIMSWHPRDLPVFFMPKVADKEYIDSVQALQKSVPAQENLAPFLQIPAASFVLQRTFGSLHFSVLPDLGIGGSGVAVLPMNFKAGDSSLSGVPYLEYAVKLTEGLHRLTVKCLPTQSTDNDGKLWYAISVNGEQPVWVNIHAESESRQWKENVLRGFAAGSSTHHFRQSTSRIRLYFPDPGMVANRIEVQ